VDDEPDIRKFFVTLSETWGISCTVAASGEEAVEPLQHDTTYDIYFVDWNLQT
jgi:CheY-like chemotaxis protein